VTPTRRLISWPPYSPLFDPVADLDRSAWPRERLIDDIARRCRPACADWPEPAFAALVARMADAEIKWRTRDSVGGADVGARGTG
jgi:hypothetical protein